MKTKSLKNRYIIFASLVSALVLLVALFGYQNAKIISEETTQNIANRRQVLNTVNNIRIMLFEGYKSLDAFLLDPSRKNTQFELHKALKASIQDSKQLLKYTWISENNLNHTVENLISAITQLGENAEELLKLRIDPLRQFPSLGVGNKVLSPNRNNINNMFSLIIDDPNLKATLIQNHELYNQVIHTRHLWTQTLSNFRIYLANRLGSFRESSLPTQEKAIETMYSELEKQITQLIEKNPDEIPFEIVTALEEIATSAKNWFKGYLNIKRIHHSGNWRTDATFIKQTIEPRLNDISILLKTIDAKIEVSGNKDYVALAEVAKLQTTIVISVTAIGLVFILLVLLSLQRLIFNPINSVAKALKAEAFGKEGALIPSVRSTETQQLIEAFDEMRKQVHFRQAELEHQALHDALTNLPNRTLLLDRMDQAINAAKREKHNLTLLLLDMDRFKEVNDTLGHHVGDNLLKEVGDRLVNSLRQIDTVARLGGDEYAIFLPDTDVETAKLIAQKILNSLEKVFIIDNLKLLIKASIGMAEYPDHGKDASTLIQHADVAMYFAKRGQLGYSVYNPTEDEYSIGRLALVSDLRDALANNTLSLHYQPKVNLNGDEIVGVECLLRWDHFTYGLISPDQVVTLAEQTGLINELTYWVLNQAFYHCSKWTHSKYNIDVSVNLSMFNLKNIDLIPYIKSLFEKYNLQPKYITLEITESAMMANPKLSMSTLQELNKMGITLSIDDFGTGFSSLAYLKQLPVDELKIDKSFVMDLLEDENDFAIVKSIIDLAHNLGISVVAEGVESAEIYDSLKKLNCDSAQGYYIYKPFNNVDIEQIFLSRSIPAVSGSRSHI